MTTRFKDFGSGDSSTKEPLSFALYGETFNCRPALQGKFLLDLISKSNDDNPAVASAIVTEFFQEVLDKDSAERFTALSSDPEKIVSVETLSEITAWLVGEYTSRPTQPLETSSNGE